MTARAAFKQVDLERVFKAAKKADVRVVATIRPTGDIEARVLTDTEELAHGRRNPLDRLHG